MENYNQLSRICPECRGYILGDYNNCPYCGIYLKGERRKIGFYTVLFVIFLILMLLALALEGRYDSSYRKIQPYIDHERTIDI